MARLLARFAIVGTLALLSRTALLVEWSPPAFNDGDLAMAALTEGGPRTLNVTADAAALDEMLRGANGRIDRWRKAPELVVLTSIMDYDVGDPMAHTASADQLTAKDAEELVADLTTGLAVLTDNTFQRFAAVHHERATPGAKVHVVRHGQIVVGRYRDVRARLKTIGLGGRRSRSDGTITGGTVVLDHDFDSTSPRRKLLRIHELGHAIGYNHVSSHVSIMNPEIGPDVSEFDRAAIRLAFEPTRPGF